MVIHTKTSAIFPANDLSLATGYEGAILPKAYDAALPIAEVSTPFVVNGKKITAWDPGRTLYDNNDRDLIRRHSCSS